jgi:hypothetical protein
LAALKAAGVPDRAMTFLHEHTTVDVAHNNLMQEYLHRLVRTEADLSAVIYATKVTGYLYGEMLWGAMNSVEQPFQGGMNIEESLRSSVASDKAA